MGNNYFVQASDSKKQEDLDNAAKQISSLHSQLTNKNNAKQSENLTKLLEALTQVEEQSKCTSLFDWQFHALAIRWHKSSDKDIQKLDDLKKAIESLYTDLSTSTTRTAETKKPDYTETLQLINQIYYTPSMQKIWARRAAYGIFVALTLAASVAVLAFLFTPGVSFAAIAKAVPTTLMAIGALFGGTPVTKIIPVFGKFSIKTEIGVPAVLPLQMLLLPLYAVPLIARNTLHPRREVAATHAQTAAFLVLADKMLDDVEKLGEGQVKNALTHVIQEAQYLMQRGAGRWFHEYHQADRNKAQLLLQAVTSALQQIDDISDISALMNIKVKDSITFEQVVFAQRNTTTLFQTQKTGLYRRLQREGDTDNAGALKTVGELSRSMLTPTAAA